MITEQEAFTMYDDMLDDCYPEVKIGYATFRTSFILKELDPIAYDCGYDDYCSSLADEGEVIEGYNDAE
jgi:hypothetical protein